MNKKVWLAASALMALAVCGTAMLSYAQETQQTSPATPAATQAWKGHRHGHMAKLAKELNLTDAQKQQVKTIVQANRQANLPLMQQLAANKKALLASTTSANYDQNKVQAIANQQSQLMAQLIAQKTAVRHQIYTQVLTPEQRLKADDLQARQMARIDRQMQRFATPQSQGSQQ